MYRDGEEKDHAFKGMCLLLLHNTSVLSNHIEEFCIAIASWYYIYIIREVTPIDDLNNLILQVFNSYKANNLSNFNQEYLKTASCYRLILRERYNL